MQDSQNSTIFNFVSIDENYPNAAAILSELSTETFLQAYSDVHSLENIQAYCAEHYSQQAFEIVLQQDPLQIMVAYDNRSLTDTVGTPAGFYVLKNHNCSELHPAAQTGQCTELKQIYVLAEYYGTGLGLNLFHQAIEQAQAHQSHWLWLCVSNKNQRAQSFYKKRGFSYAGEGPELVVGTDTLSSSILLLAL